MLDNNFTTFITIDNHLSFQQNFINSPLPVVVLIARNNVYETIMEFLPSILAKVKEHFAGAQAVVHPDFSLADWKAQISKHNHRNAPP